MGLIMGDPDLLTRPPEAPPLPPTERETGRRRMGWWWAPLVVAIIAAGIALGVLLTRDDGTTVAIDVVPDYEVDTPLVVYEPGFWSADFFVGTDANLDPDNTWFQEEYLHDTPLVTYATDMPTFWIGSSGDELNPDR